MNSFFVITTLFLAFTLTTTFADVSSLQDQDDNQDHIDPLNDKDQDLTTNNQDKRTICGALNKCSGSGSGGHARHVLLKSGLRHQLIGYAPVVRPVRLRQVVLGGYKYPKPKIQFRLKAPSSLKPVFGGWTPVISSTQPAVHVVKPAGHVDVVHNDPVPHVDHEHTAPAPSNVDHVHVDHVHVQPSHVHVQPVQPTYVHQHPVAVQGAHIDQVHQVNVPRGNTYDAFTHIDHIHQTAVPVAQPVVPVAPPPTIVKSFVPHPVLFEVTRPNLGVLPIGARFPSPILREIPQVHFKAAVPVAQAVPIAPQAVFPEPVHSHHYHPVPHQAVQGIIQTPVGLPHIVPQPGVSVEYHGTRNYQPFAGAVPFLHQTPVNAVQPLIPAGFGLSAAYPHQHVSFEHHGNQGFLHQQQLPHDHQPHAFLHQQQLPHDHQPHTFLHQQQLPHDHQPHAFLHQQQLPHDHQPHAFLHQQQLPHDHQPQAFLHQQQLPHDHQAQFAPEHQLPQDISANFLRNQVQAAQHYQDIPQGQLPLEGEQNFDQFLQNNQHSFSSNSVNVQNFDHNNVIQPGQTDVQIPYHLPQHPGWEEASGLQQQSGVQEESRGFGDQVFRPSQQLEAPYQK